MKKPIKSVRFKTKSNKIKVGDKFYIEKCPEKTSGATELDVSFQQAIWPVIAGAHIFGIMPIVGVRAWRNGVPTFKWLSVRTILCLLTMLLGSIVVYMYMHRLHQAGYTAKNLGGALFFVFSLIVAMFFLCLACKWQILMEHWNKTDQIFVNAPYSVHGFRLSTKIRATAVFFICMALSEHIIYLVQNAWIYQLQIKRCKWSVNDYWRNFITAEHNYIFELVPYNVPLAIIIVWINTTCIICWSYGDLFIMLVSIGIATRFQQINRRIVEMRGKSISEDTWYQLRQHYVAVCELLDAVDDNLAHLIVLSCANNLYFICLQLLNIFKQQRYFMNYLYVWYSLVFLVFRTICVFLVAGTIHDAAKRPISDISNIRTEEWYPEVDRFFDQITSMNVALSGMKFFHLTRKVLLGMIGTIVTYELVLLQFDKGDPKTEQVDDTRLEQFCHHVRVRVS